MTTYPHRPYVGRPHVGFSLVAAVGLAAALIGLGAWVLVDRYAGGTSATDSAASLIDRFTAAGNAGDASALSGLITNDFVMRSEGSTIVGKDALIAAATLTAGTGMQMIERIAPVTVSGNLATTFARVTDAGVPRTVVSVFQLSDGKLSRLWGFDVGTTPPFDNAKP